MKRYVRGRVTEAEIAEITRLGLLGMPACQIAPRIGRARSTLCTIINKLNLPVPLAEGARNSKRGNKPVVAIKKAGKRVTREPRKLPAAERSTYPINFAAHARMLRW